MMDFADDDDADNAMMEEFFGKNPFSCTIGPQETEEAEQNFWESERPPLLTTPTPGELSLSPDWMENCQDIENLLQQLDDAPNILSSNPMLNSSQKNSEEVGVVTSNTTQQQPLFEKTGASSHCYKQPLDSLLPITQEEFDESLKLLPYLTDSSEDKAVVEEPVHVLGYEADAFQKCEGRVQSLTSTDPTSENSCVSQSTQQEQGKVILVLVPVISVSTPSLSDGVVPSRKRRANECPGLCPGYKKRRLNAAGSAYYSLEETTRDHMDRWDPRKKTRIRASHSMTLARKLLEDRETAPSSVLLFLDNTYGFYWKAFLDVQVPWHPEFPAIGTRSTMTGPEGTATLEEDALPSFRKQEGNIAGKLYPEVTWGMTKTDILASLGRQQEEGVQTHMGVVGSPEGRIRHMQSFMAHEAAFGMLEYRHKLDLQAAEWVDDQFGHYWEIYLNCKPKLLEMNPEHREVSTATENDQ